MSTRSERSTSEVRRTGHGLYGYGRVSEGRSGPKPVGNRRAISEDTVVVVAEGLSVAELDGEAVILSSRTSTYFGLNEVGARAFDLARSPRSIREIVDLMLDEYLVEPVQLTRDLVRFFCQLDEAHLIDIGGAEANAASAGETAEGAAA